MKGCDNSFGHFTQRGTSPPKDVMVRDGDLWSDYKRTREHNQGRKDLKTRRERRFAILRQMKRGSSLKE
jgi:hypothetical protein